jgi:hypothetical protein
MSAFLQSGRFYHGETPIFRVRFRPEADVDNDAEFVTFGGKEKPPPERGSSFLPKVN